MCAGVPSHLLEKDASNRDSDHRNDMSEEEMRERRGRLRSNYASLPEQPWPGHGWGAFQRLERVYQQGEIGPTHLFPQHLAPWRTASGTWKAFWATGCGMEAMVKGWVVRRRSQVAVDAKNTGGGGKFSAYEEALDKWIEMVDNVKAEKRLKKAAREEKEGQEEERKGKTEAEREQMSKVVSERDTGRVFEEGNRELVRQLEESDNQKKLTAMRELFHGGFGRRYMSEPGSQAAVRVSPGNEDTGRSASLELRMSRLESDTAKILEILKHGP
ncbi:hypothetical protein FN846DRAFT_896233 [Sphaerosporella brunnea]|uniref:Uncharacterized protein n=1 Tax=Sphaerosporella brunnea TaxID=1250544 RepID=A0A5J5EDQ1_9PEZI|nr:hypothetical protein FN846DRAFT_896233 [Sphaerosporella brunnea]